MKAGVADKKLSRIALKRRVNLKKKSHNVGKFLLTKNTTVKNISKTLRKPFKKSSGLVVKKISNQKPIFLIKKNNQTASFKILIKKSSKNIFALKINSEFFQKNIFQKIKIVDQEKNQYVTKIKIRIVRNSQEIISTENIKQKIKNNSYNLSPSFFQFIKISTWYRYFTLYDETSFVKKIISSNFKKPFDFLPSLMVFILLLGFLLTGNSFVEKSKFQIKNESPNIFTSSLKEFKNIFVANVEESASTIDPVVDDQQSEPFIKKMDNTVFDVTEGSGQEQSGLGSYLRNLKNGILVEPSIIIPGKPVEYTLFIESDAVTSDQHLVVLPKEAINITVQDASEQQKEQIIHEESVKKSEGLTLEQRQELSDLSSKKHLEENQSQSQSQNQPDIQGLEENVIDLLKITLNGGDFSEETNSSSQTVPSIEDGNNTQGSSITVESILEASELAQEPSSSPDATAEQEALTTQESSEPESAPTAEQPISPSEPSTSAEEPVSTSDSPQGVPLITNNDSDVLGSAIVPDSLPSQVLTPVLEPTPAPEPPLVEDVQKTPESVISPEPGPSESGQEAITNVVAEPEQTQALEPTPTIQSDPITELPTPELELVTQEPITEPTPEPSPEPASQPDVTNDSSPNDDQPALQSLDADYIKITYELPSPEIIEQDIAQGKMVIVSNDNISPVSDDSDDSEPIHLKNVLAFTSMPEIFKVGEEYKIQVTWKNNGNQGFPFTAYDLNSNEYIDYIEWIVPHLSTQTFDIIYISKAVQLDSAKNIIADIYEKVKTQDQQYAHIKDGQYIRVTFEQILDETRDITIYAKSEAGAAIEVYAKDSGQLVTTFEPINQAKAYKILLTHLETPTDTFDLKVSGNVDVDYIVDPNSVTWSGAVNGNWSNAGNWTGGVAPTNGDDLVFPSGASNLSNTNDLTTGTLFNSISFSSGGYTLAGNDIILGQGFAGITDTASSTNTISLNITMTAVRTITVSSTQTLTISGAINGVAGGITKEGSGKLVLSGANSYTGVTTINTGVLNIRHATGLGTITANTTVLPEAALELQGNITVLQEALTLYGTGVSSGGALRNISGTNTFGGAITLINANGATITSDSGTLTLTGGVSGAFPLTIDGAGNVTFTTAPVATSGSTLTKNGSGTLTLTSINTYTGLTTVNAGTLAYGASNAILTGGITVTGGTLDIGAFSDQVGAVTITGGTITGTTGILSGSSIAAQAGTISAILGGDGTVLTKTTTGTVTLTRPNVYTGATTISAGILTIQDSSALGALDGQTSVASGAALYIDGSGLSIAETISSLAGTGVSNGGALRNLANNNTWTGAIVLSATPTIASDSGTLTIATGGITGAGQALTIAGAGNITFTTAPITITTGTLTKNGTGTLTLQAVNPYSGATTINQGTLTLSGSGTIVSSAVTINLNGTLTLDNSGTNVTHRLIDGTALTMNGGNFNFIGSSSADSYEYMGALTSSTGDNIITVTPGAGGFTKAIFSSLTRTAGSQVLFRGTSLGSTPAANVSTILFTNAPTLTGGSGAENTTTISIIRGAFGDASLTGTGTDMVTYNVGNTNGLRLLNGAGFSGEYLSNSFGTTNANVKLTASTTAATATINSIILGSGGAIADAGSAQTITFSSLAGNILSLTGNSGIAGTNTTLNFGGVAEAMFRTPANLTVSGVIDGTAGLTTGGTGILTLSGTGNVYTGTTNINAGTLAYGTSNAIFTGNVAVTGGTYNLAGFSDSIGALTLTGGSVTTGAGTLTLGGTLTTNASATSSTITGKLDLGLASRTFAVANGAVANDLTISAVISSAFGAFAPLQTGAGTMVLSGANTFTGTPTIAATSVMNIQNATALGTGTVTVTVASTGALQLQGGITVASNISLSMAGTGVSTDGALRNISGNNTWAGTITLTAASQISSDAGTLTVSGAVDNGTFLLTVRGVSDTVISGVISNTGGLTKNDAGTLTLSGSNSYTGTTTITAGTIKLGAAGDATNTPLGTTAGATSITSGAVLDLNGFTLGTVEGLTVTGSGISSGGALINSSATAVTYSGLLIFSSPTITANFGDINITNTGTITGAGSVLTLNGSGNGSIASIIGTTTGTVTKTGAGTWTLSGSSTFTGAVTVQSGTLKLGATGDATNTPFGTVASSVTVLNGAVLDLNGFTLGTAEALTINGNGISNGGALTNTGGAATYSGAITRGTATMITNSGSGTLTLSGANSGSAINLTVQGSANTTISGVIGSSTATLTKDGSGTLTLSAANTYTGVTQVNDGTLKYGNTNTLSSGPVTITGGSFDLASFSDTVGAFTLIGGSLIDSTSGTNGILTTTSYTVESGTISAIIAGAVTMTKNTKGTLTMTAAETYSGATTINAGTITLSGSGSAVSSAFTINLGGTLTLDNTSTNVASRLGDATALTMNSGNFNFIGSSSAAASETTGALTLSTGDNIVTITPAAGGSTTMTFASFARSAGAQVLFRGTSFGSSSAANVSTLLFTTDPTLTGGGGADNTTTISIIQGAFGDNSLTGTGTDMVTYNESTSNGLRLLNGAGFSGEYLSNSFGTTNANVKLTASTTAATATINSLILGSGGAVADAGSAQTITFTTGNILSLTGNTGIAGANTTIGNDSVELTIRTPANLTISSIINDSGLGGSLTTGGNGTLTLSAVNTYTGATTINAGTLAYGIADATSTSNVVITGGTYNLAGFNDTIRGLTLTGGSVTTGAGTLTLGGALTTNASATSSTITGKLDLGSASRTFAIANGTVANDLVVSAVISSASGAFAPLMTGAGTMVLSGANTFTGTSTIAATSVMNIQNATALGTGTATATVASTGALQLQGGITVASNISLSMAGTGVSTDGALRNISGNNTWAGTITLTAASRINSDAGLLTISGAISGATFLTTVGGDGDTTISGVIGTTSGGVTKDGNGILTLSGSNTYTGTTTISAGTLKLGAAGDATNTPLGTTGGITSLAVATGAVLDLNGFTLGTAEPLTMRGTGLALGGSLVNSSVTAVTYSGLLTFGAALTISANAGDINLTNTGTITGAGVALTINGSGNGSIASIVGTTTGTITKTGAGTWTLSGASTYTGLTTVSAGTLKLGAAGGGTDTPFGTTAGGVTVSTGGVLDLNGFTLLTSEQLNLSGTGINNGGGLINNSAGAVSYSGAIVLGVASRITNSGAGLLTLSGTITGAFALMIQGAGDTTYNGITATAGTTLTKNDSGTLTLGNFNGHTGLTRVNAGTLKYGGSDALSSGAVTVAGGTFDIAGFTDTVGAVTLLSGTITDSVGGGVLTATSYTVESGTISAVIAGAVAMTKNTAGTVTLTKANTFSGLTTVNAGTLLYGINNALSSGGITVAGGTLDIATFTDTVGTVTLTGGTITGSTGVLTSNANFALQSGTVSAIIDGLAIGITATTAGTVTLTRANTFTGASTIAATSKLNIQNAGALGTGTVTITITSGGVLQLQGGITVDTTKSLTLAGTGIATDGALRNISGNNTWQGTVTMTAASRFHSDSGTLTISGAISGATFAITVSGMGNTTISGVIGTTSGTVTKSDVGTLTLSGNNTYTGLTTISAGTLKLGATGDATNTPLGTTGAGTTVSGIGTNGAGGVLDLNGFTLGTAEALTLNGTGIASGGALTNSSATAATYSGLITLGSASSIVAPSGDIIISNAGTITGATFGLTLGGTATSSSLASIIGTTSGTVTKIGSGTWTLSGSSTYTGLTTISAGTLKLGAAGGATNTPLGTTGAGTTVSSGAVLDLNGFSLGTTEALTLNGTGISSGGALTNTGATATYSGLITLGSVSSIVATTSGDITISNAGTITGATFGLTLGGAGNGTLTSILGTTSGTLTKEGAGTWTLAGVNTYTGITTINAGILSISADSGLGTAPGSPTAGQITFGGGTLQTTASFTLDVNRSIAMTGAGTISTDPSTTLVYAGTIAGTGTLTKSGTGTLQRLTNTLSLGGAFTITAGVYDANGLANTVTGLTTVSGGTYTASTATQTFNGGLTISGGTFTGASNSLVDVNGDFTESSGTFTAPGSSGTFTVSGNFAHSGGTFTHSSGTVTLDGTNQTVTGATTFANLTKQDASDNSTSLTITFGSATTFSITGILTLDGLDANDKLLIAASTPTNASIIDFTGTSSFTGDFLTITDNTALDNSSSITLPISPANSTNGGNTTGWFAATFSISGTVYSDEGTTALGSVSIAISINGAAAAGSNTSNGSGVYSITGLTILAGDILTLYIDGVSQKAVAVTVATGANQSGVDLYQNDLIARCDNASCSLTNANLDTADNNGDADISAIYSVSGGALTVAAGKSLFIPSSHTFAPGGNVSVGGNFTNNGTFTHGSSTVTLTGTGTQTLKTNASSLHNLTINGSGGTYTLQDNITVANVLAISAGTLDASSRTITLSGTTGTPFTNAGTFTPSTSTVTYTGNNGGGNTTVANVTYNHLTLNNSSETYVLAGNTTANGDLTITAGTLDAVSGSNYNLNVGGNWSNSGTFTARLGTVTLTGTGKSITGSTTFYNFTKSVSLADTLTFPASATQTIATGGTLTLSGASAQLLSLRSSSTPTQWGITVNGSSSVSYVDVKDSDASGGSAIVPSNSTNSLNNLNWTFDTTAPTTTDDYGAKDNVWQNANQTITLTPTDTGGSGIATTKYCTDSTNTCDPATGTDYTVAVVITTEGTTYFRYRSTDNAGNIQATVSRIVKIDKTNPSVNAGNDQTKSAQFTQDATASDATSGITSYLWSKVSGSGTITFGSSTAEDTTVSASANDTYVIRLTVTDNAGNSASDDFTLVWSVPSPTPPPSGGGGGTVGGQLYVPPREPLNILMNNGSFITDSRTVTLTLEGGPDSVTMEISNEGFQGVRENYQKTKTWTLSQGDGQKTVHVKFYTSLDVASRLLSASIILDTVPPLLVITNMKNSYGVNEEVVLGGTTEPNTQITLLIDNAVGLFNADQQGNWYITLGKKNQGKHYVQLTPKDTAGNIGKTVAAEFWAVSYGPPEITPPSPSQLLPPFTLAPPLEPIFQELAKAIEFLPKLFNPIVKVEPEPVVTIPKETPVAFKGAFHYISTKTLARFVLAPLPNDVKIFAQKFPEVEKTFNKVGINKFTDVEKLRNADLKLPTLTETVTPEGDLQAGKFALVKGIPVAKMSVAEKNRIPSDIVFARGPAGLIDFNVALSINDKGKTEQRIQTIARHPIRLVVKADKPVKRVIGYIVFKSRKSNQVNFTVPLDTIAASPLFSNPDFTAAITPSVLINVEGNNATSELSIQATIVPEKNNKEEQNNSNLETRLVVAEFEYVDSGEGVYTATVDAPTVAGEYEIITVMDYSDPELVSKEIKLITVVDPEGYIYEKTGSQETRIGGAVVSLYWLNPETKNYELWLAEEFQQENPQTTNVTGRYSFLVPEGYYYLKVDAPGYLSYEGKPFEVTEGSGVHLNIELKTKHWFIKLIDWKTTLLIIVIMLLAFNFYKDKLRERRIKI